jgi:pyridoxal phosphate enzyme (YggS family)
MIAENIQRIKKQVNSKVILLAATKGRTIEEISQAVAAGITVIGENRVQELLKKLPHLSKQTRIDFIGHLQTNKVKDVIKICFLIHSVDSFRLAQEINSQAKKIGKVQNILLEVNIANEPTKFGFKKEELVEVLPKLLALPNIKIKGLMTMAASRYFKELKEFKNFLEKQFNISLPELSMGMSNDYKTAIEEEATIIRLGRIIFD